MRGDTGQVKEKKIERTFDTRSPEGLCGYLRTVSQSWVRAKTGLSGVDNLDSALRFALSTFPGAESLWHSA